jgi:DNA invertase Pin-like site-specific DNA recombinase
MKASGVQKVHKDTASGKNADRPGLARAIKAVEPGDTLVVWYSG